MPPEQAIRARRAVALVALVVVVILIVVGVHSCQVSQANSDLRNYSLSVAALIRSSDQTGRQFFGLLSTGQGVGGTGSLQSQVDTVRLTASGQLSRAEGLNAPGQLQAAQQNLVMVMRMRADGIASIASNLPAAFQAQSSSNAVTSISAEMARFYASDVLYKDYALPMLVSALRQAGIPAGGTGGEPINQGQFLPNVLWLTPSFVASQLKAAASTSGSGGKPAPGTHGHQLNSVSVGGTALQTGTNNTVTGTPPPTFTLNFANSGQNAETNVTCKVSVSGTNISGTSTVAHTSPGQSYSCQVTLGSSPPAGAYTVTATVEPVPGEKVTANNTLTFPVTFQ